MPDQSHSGFLGAAPAFFVVAVEATCDNVIPSFSSSVDNWNDVIKSQIFGRAFLAAILACVIVTTVNIGSAKLDMLETFSDLYILQQPEDAGQLYREADASNLTVIFGQNLHFALIKQREGSFPGDDIDWLKSCI